MKIKKKILFSPIIVIALIVLFGVGIAGAAIYLGNSGDNNSLGINLQKGLVGHWNFNGDAKDSSPYANNGTLNGDATITAADRKGQTNKAVSFNGAGYVNVPDADSLDMSSNVTVSAWVKLTDVADTRQIVNKNNDGNGNNEPYYFAVSATTGKLYGRFGNGAANNDIAGTTAVNDGTWHHVVFAYDTAFSYLYVDGNSDKTPVAKTVTPVVNTTALMIGSWNNTWNKYVGQIDDVRIYNRTLSATEVKALYNEYDPGIQVSDLQKGLVGQWKLDGDAKDSSPYENNGTATGTTPSLDRKMQAVKAYNFNGTTDVVTVASSTSLSPTTAVTIGGWVYDPPLLSSSEKVSRAASRDLAQKSEARSTKSETPPLTSLGDPLNPLRSLLDPVKFFLGFSKKPERPYATAAEQEKFHEDLAQQPIGTTKLISPYNKVTNLGNGKFSAEISNLPLTKADLTPIDSSWHKEWGKWVAGENLFSAEINGNKTHIAVGNDQPFKNIKQGDDVTFAPQLTVGGKEYKAKGEPKLLAIDPLNPNYKNNTLEWDYGIAIRRLRVIEGNIQGSWVFKENPKADVAIKYNQKGKLALNLGGSSSVGEGTLLKVAVKNNDEEIVTTQQFNNIAMENYPVSIADSATYYPDANPETTSVDGYVRRTTDNQTWATIHDSTGEGAFDASTAFGVETQNGTNNNTLTLLKRSIILFNTSALVGATVTAATLSLYGSVATGPGAWEQTVNIVSSSPASNTSLATGDYLYSSFGTTVFSTGIARTSWSTVAYNNFVLNASGIANISTSGISKFGLRDQTYDIANSAPPYNQYDDDNVGAWASEQGLGYQPKLVVTYTPPPVIIGKGHDAYSLEIDSSLNVTGYISGSASSTTQITKAWHHVVMTYDGANIKLYIDGVLQVTTAKTGAIGTNSTALSLGSLMAGKLDDMRVYNRALSQAEVTAWHNEYDPGIQVSNLQKGLIGWWNFDGEAKDSTPKSNNGTVSGATLTIDRKGQTNRAYNFDGSSGVITVPNFGTQIPTSEITIAVWVKPAAGTANDDLLCTDVFEPGGGSNRMNIHFPWDTTIYWQFGKTFQGASVALDASWVSVWGHYVFTASIAGNFARIYRNGAQVSVEAGFTNPYDPSTDATLRIGGRASNPFQGDMDDLRIYNRVLSPTEITALYESY